MTTATSSACASRSVPTCWQTANRLASCRSRDTKLLQLPLQMRPLDAKSCGSAAWSAEDPPGFGQYAQDVLAFGGSEGTRGGRQRSAHWRWRQFVDGQNEFG